MTINNEAGLTTRKRKRRPRRGAVRRQAWEESVPPANLAVRHRGERSRHIGVAQVHGRAPAEGPLVPEQVDDEGEGEHEFTVSAEAGKSLCNAQIRPATRHDNGN